MDATHGQRPWNENSKSHSPNCGFKPQHVLVIVLMSLLRDKGVNCCFTLIHSIVLWTIMYYHEIKMKVEYAANRVIFCKRLKQHVPSWTCRLRGEAHVIWAQLLYRVIVKDKNNTVDVPNGNPINIRDRCLLQIKSSLKEGTMPSWSFRGVQRGFFGSLNLLISNFWHTVGTQ